jgi:hypothetical protein
LLARFLAASCVVLGAGLPSAVAADRPPQFVAISFDNCGELDRWQELSEFLAATNRDGGAVRFTFFVSGTNFLSYAKRGLYRGPGQAPGVANIAFGGSAADVRRRVEFINRLHAQGHEIGSHAVGHFDGARWTQGDWRNEFGTYRELFLRVGPNHGAQLAFAFAADEVAGFRAPYLSRGPALYAALREAGFRYDASGVGNADTWPEKQGGVWRFNLASLRIAGSGKYTLSMDYNFLVAQSDAAGNARLRQQYREEMLRTYLAYFRANYSGNRAPVHIGHHFSPMQGGAYTEALKDFVRKVCRLPEVRCVTYRELADYLDGLSAETLQAFRAGKFPRASAMDIALR